MGFRLNEIVPWGRSLDEYTAMFSLSSDDLRRSILDCGGGPASFNADLTADGGRVVSVDPLYAYNTEEIEYRIAECFDDIVRETKRNSQQFVWHTFESVEELAHTRRASMDLFLANYRQGDSRYLNASLPFLPFKDSTFDLAICSHLLFLYSEQLDLDFHLDSILELRRVAKEVRIFPLLDLNTNRSPYIDAVCNHLEKRSFHFSIEKVGYEIQRGGNEMMRVL